VLLFYRDDKFLIKSESFSAPDAFLQFFFKIFSGVFLEDRPFLLLLKPTPVV